ncbi:MAG: hypothetical protein ATN36_00680 [Epulopiscium sp. Nele67-Bin005]|nr:MAG: hypothetical protein ATN36_00680 [Epulopiscium sp. Nele67-Bin005]
MLINVVQTAINECFKWISPEEATDAKVVLDNICTSLNKEIVPVVQKELEELELVEELAPLLEQCVTNDLHWQEELVKSDAANDIKGLYEKFKDRDLTSKPEIIASVGDLIGVIEHYNYDEENLYYKGFIYTCLAWIMLYLCETTEKSILKGELKASLEGLLDDLQSVHEEY